MKVFPSTASTPAFTTPPKRVAMPPASTMAPTCPAAIASRPFAASASRSALPTAGSVVTSSASGGVTSPRMRFCSAPA